MTEWATLSRFCVLLCVAAGCKAKESPPAPRSAPVTTPWSTSAPAGPSVPTAAHDAASHGELELRSIALEARIASFRNGGPTALWEGREPSTTEPGIDAVGALLAIAPNGAINMHCTAMLIAPDVVITAGHCFMSQLCGGVANAAHRDAFDFVQGRHPKDSGARNRIVGMACISANPCDGDIALARLTNRVAFDARTDLRISDPDIVIPLVKIGYGAYHPTDSDPDNWVSAGTRSEATGRIDPPPWISQGIFTYRGVNANGGQVEICGADSGGPGMQISGSEYRLVGITSGSVGTSNAPTAANCNPIAMDTRLSIYVERVKSTLARLPTVTGNQCP